MNSSGTFMMNFYHRSSVQRAGKKKSLNLDKFKDCELQAAYMAYELLHCWRPQATSHEVLLLQFLSHDPSRPFGLEENLRAKEQTCHISKRSLVSLRVAVYTPYLPALLCRGLDFPLCRIQWFRRHVTCVKGHHRRNGMRHSPSGTKMTNAWRDTWPQNGFPVK
jgi:hypothetical protein